MNHVADRDRTRRLIVNGASTLYFGYPDCDEPYYFKFRSGQKVGDRSRFSANELAESAFLRTMLV